MESSKATSAERTVGGSQVFKSGGTVRQLVVQSSPFFGRLHSVEHNQFDPAKTFCRALLRR